MADGSNYLTTYYAKRIIGDTAAANAAKALLQTGTGIDTNTWILHRDNRNDLYGIKYFYDSSSTTDKIEFYGGVTGANSNDLPTAWVQLHTGDAYLLGRLGIGYDPTDSNTNKLYVNGTSYFTDSLTINNGCVNGEVIRIAGANNAVFSFKLSGSTAGSNVDIGWNWTNVEGAGAAFRSTSFPSQAGEFRIYARKKNSSNTAVYTQLIGTAGETTNGGALTWADRRVVTSTDGAAVGSTTLPVYVDSSGIAQTLSYSLNATVNSGTASYMAYYNGVNAISGTSSVRMADGCLSLFPTSSNYREGLRIHSVSSWSDITLCGNDNTGDTGTSANSWFIGNNNGNFYISRNGSPGSTAYIGCVSNVWKITTSADIPEGAANLSATATAHTLSLYRNGIIIPYQMDNVNDGGMLRVRGTSESTTILELGTWDDSGAGETIQFNYYPTTSQVTPAYSIAVPKETGTIFLRVPWWTSGNGNNADTLRHGCTFAYTNHNCPTSGTLVAFDCSTDENYTLQLQGQYSGDALYFRNRNGDAGTWRSWQRVVHNSGTWSISVTGSSGSCTGNALTCSYPYGFASKTDNATWGNTTGTSIVSWNDSTGGSIAFRRDNPSSGKMSIKVDGRFYGNEGNYPAMLLRYANNYWGMGTPDAEDAWIRTTTSGIIPNQAGGAGSGHCGLGTSSWYFSYVYADNFYGKFNGDCTGSAGSVTWANVSGKPLYTRSSVGTLDWSTYKDYVVMNSAMAYWNGCYSGTSSNLQYCDRGRFGTIVTKGTGDYLGASANATSATRINGNLGAITDANGHNIWISSTASADGIPKYVSGCYVQPSTCTIVATKVKNAVWNDYAECRISNELEAGRCVTETATINGMIRTTERLMPGCKFVSDTYGTLMGETDKAKTPIAVSGRVLAYPYRPKKEYLLGAAVCSAPNGTIDIMTRDEVMKYPERIVGTVSEIPDYEIWHGGSTEVPTDIQVNGRIWVYVR